MVSAPDTKFTRFLPSLRPIISEVEFLYGGHMSAKKLLNRQGLPGWGWAETFGAAQRRRCHIGKKGHVPRMGSNKEPLGVSSLVAMNESLSKSG